jgi:DNA-binding XRE family transcriptional regulator
MASRVEIGKKVRIERKSLGYTQQKLSELIRINKTTILRDREWAIYWFF